MIYLEYEATKQRYGEIKAKFESVLREKEELFTRTLPSAIKYDKDQVQVSRNENSLEEYMIQCEQKHIEERLASLRQLLDDWSRLVMLKEIELRKSPCIEDKIYTFRFLDGMSMKQIGKILNYSKSQVYRLVKELRC